VSRIVGVCLAAIAIAVGAAGCSLAVSRQASKQPHRGALNGTPLAPLGSRGYPLMLSCDQTSRPPLQGPRPGDLVVGPLWIINGREPTDPAGAGPHPEHGYKYPIAVAPGATVTIMIAPPARGDVVIDNPYGPPSGVIAATYRACRPGLSRGWSVFVQFFIFTNGRTRGCVPLTVRTGRNTRIRHVTVSLAAGPCPAGAEPRSTASRAVALTAGWHDAKHLSKRRWTCFLAPSGNCT
jgi:hypothetical protein